MLQSILSLTKEFISIPSVGGNREEIDKILNVAKRELPEFSFESFISNNHPSLLYSNKSTVTNHFDIILNAHLDVVPAEEKQFIPYEKDGKLYGRGAKDMKAASAVMILLFKELAKKVDYTLGLQIVTDEEPGGLDGTGYQVQQGVTGKFIICGEGTDLIIINKAKARMLVKLTTTGISAHSAYPWRGDNAVLKMHEVLAAIHKVYPTPREEYEQTTVTITSFKTENDTYNKIPDKCIAYLDIRFLPNEKDSIVEKIKSLLPETIHMEIIFKFFPHETNPTNKYLQLLEREGQKIVPKGLKLGLAHGASDAAFYSEVACDSIEFGPVGDNHHSYDEWVDIKSLEDYYHILKNFLLSVPTL
ncbi:MAG TPA: M20/M25/M40 family metallo-hydrolase [Candidatus Saccharimonadales bacterium]|nr:M20/M25/M40 family metallo-hydrolase [Candidatus Saccharimonadales bacterium]